MQDVADPSSPRFWSDLQAMAHRRGVTITATEIEWSAVPPALARAVRRLLHGSVADTRPQTTIAVTITAAPFHDTFSIRVSAHFQSDSDQEFLLYIRALSQLYPLNLAVDSSDGDPVTLVLSWTEADARAWHSAPCRHVLVVDDTEINRLVCAHILKDAGYTVELVEDGAAAVARVCQADAQPLPDLILMDLQMPVMDGQTAIRTIRAASDPRVATLPILALTADVDGPLLDVLDRIGCDGLMAKPVDPALLARWSETIIGVCSSVAEHGDPEERTRPDGDLATELGSSSEERDPDAVPLLDHAKLRDYVNLFEADGLADLITLFETQGPNLAAAAHGALAYGADPKAASGHAHKLASAAGSLGLVALEQAARSFEAEPTDAGAKALLQLVAESDRALKGFLTQIRSD